MPLLFLMAGCFDSAYRGSDAGDAGVDVAWDGLDRCDERQACLRADRLGCCGGAPVEVSICEMCPSGTISSTSCRTAGCEACDEPLDCVENLGDGCCGAPVFTTSCTECPAGSVPSNDCSASYPECGCGSEFGERRLPLPDAGVSDAGAGHSDASGPGIDVPPPACLQDLGGGCCGEFVTEQTECGCPVGSMPAFECGAHAGVPDLARCYESLAPGCCGAEVPPVACGTSCPPDAITELECTIFAGDSDVAFVPSCREDLGEGCCGEFVPADLCGQCPEGATMACTTFAPECS